VTTDGDIESDRPADAAAQPAAQPQPTPDGGPTSQGAPTEASPELPTAQPVPASWPGPAAGPLPAATPLPPIPPPTGLLKGVPAYLQDAAPKGGQWVPQQGGGWGPAGGGSMQHVPWSTPTGASPGPGTQWPAPSPTPGPGWGPAPGWGPGPGWGTPPGWFAPAGPVPGVAWAGMGRRFGALAIDSVFGFGLLIAISVIGSAAAAGQPLDAGTDSPGPMTLLSVAWWLVMILYMPVCWHFFGRTIGQMLVGLRVARAADGRRLGVGASIIRYAILAVCTVLVIPAIVSAAVAGDDPFVRMWHDRAARSVVVHDLS